MERRRFLKAMAIGGAGLLAGAARRAEAAADLAAHRIVRIEARQMQDRYPRPVGRNSRRGPHGHGMGYQVRIVTTDQGTSGWGMSWVPEEKVRHLVGARIADLYDPGRGTADEADVLDLPLHDLVGQILGKSVAALLGGKGPKALPIYSGAIYFDDLDPEGKPRGIPAVLANCQQDYDTGYRALKLKIGRGFQWMKPKEAGIQRDVEVTRAVREKFPDCQLLVDANDGYAVEDFLGYVTAVADCNLYWIEEPFQESRDDLRRLREHMAKVGCKALIAEGEGRTDRAEKPWRWGGYSQRHVDTLFALAKEKLVDVCLFDLGIIGFTRWRAVMPELAQAGILTSPHAWGWVPRSHYIAQLGGGLGNVCIVEGIPGTTQGVDYSAYKFQDGQLVLPEAPGFGLALKT
jgi:L-alanine-DL-glutamate epimerase-like enolase superfamily enzyme